MMTLALLGLATATPFAASAGSVDDLARQRWRSRVVVISSPDAGDPRVARQRDALSGAASGAKERDLVLVEAIGATGEARAIRARLGLPEDGFRAVLIGKDGGTKLVAAEPISPRELFGTIDAMPMRRQEMDARRR